MVTPLEIQNRDFNKSFRGYNRDEVDNFLDEIMMSYERVYIENVELKDKITHLVDKLETYEDLEKTLKDTLIVAQTAAEETTKTANQKADMIIGEAELRGEEELNKAQARIEFITLEYNQLKREFNTFKNRYISFLDLQKQSVEEFHDEIVEDIEIEENLYDDNSEA